MTQPQCVLLVGLQASGKTTFYRSRFAATHEHISKDDFPHARSRDARQASLMRAALTAGRSVVIDNTNVTPAERASAITIARDCGARVVGYFFEPSIGASIARNRLREGRARVPDVAIPATAKRLVAPDPVEGFHELYRVKLTDRGEFEVVEVAL